MSTEASSPRPFEDYSLRLTIAVLTSALVGLAIDNVFATLIAPVFATMFATPGTAPPGLGRAVLMAAVLWVVSTLTQALTGFFAAHLDMLVVMFAASIYWCFWVDASKGRKPMTGLVLMIFVLVGTMNANAAPLADLVTDTLPLSAFVAMVGVMFAHAVVPQRAAYLAGQQAEAPHAPYPVRDAVARTLILLPLIVWFLAAQKTGNFYILITAIAVLRVPRPSHVALGAIATNALGGAAALVAAFLITAIPSSLFGIVILALLMLTLGLMVEGGGARGQLAYGATGPAVILLMLSLAPLDGTEVFIDRVVLIAATVVYVVLAQVLLGTLAGPAPREAET
jgi:hypothetical protein